MAADNIASAAFFAPAISTSPTRGLPPLITYCSITHQLQNNPALCETANQDLKAAIKLGNFSSSFTYVPHIEDGKFGGTVIAKCDYKNTDLAKLIKTVTNINSHHVDKWSEVGVVVRTFDGQTYIAISVVFKT